MSLLFDELAESFARETDRALRQNGYTRGRLVLELAQRSIPAGSSVLDFGCGPGRLSLLLARSGFRVRAVDISEGMIAQARTLDRQGLDLEFERIGTSAEALEPESCDAIVCSSVIEYILDPAALLREFHQALGKPGVLIISYANRSSLWRRWDRHNEKTNPMYAPHNHSWHWHGFRALLARNGFRAIIGPVFYESPLDWRPGARLFRRVSLFGTLGMLVARPVPIESSR
ncbi:MAG: class I SAM-dependent methyltransferase [Gammaproteobacteria bacterium]